MKKILSILIVALTGLILVSCGAYKPKGAEVVVADFLDKIKALELDEESLSAYIYDYTDQLDTFDRVNKNLNLKESKILFSMYFENLTYTFKGQETTEDGTLVKTEIRNVGTRSFMKRIINEVFDKSLERSLARMEKVKVASVEEQEVLIKEAEEYLETLIKNFKFKKSDFWTKQVNFLVKKDESGADKIFLANKTEGDKLFYNLTPRPQGETETETEMTHYDDEDGKHHDPESEYEYHDDKHNPSDIPAEGSKEVVIERLEAGAEV